MIEDRSGDELFTIQEKKLSVRDKMRSSASRKMVTTVKKMLAASATATDRRRGRRRPVAKGNIVDHEYEIERDGDKVAEVSKRWFRVRDA